ncbi:MAG: hypothetical protein AAGG72_01855, partial [Pseudomonadota bacterium]
PLPLPQRQKTRQRLMCVSDEYDNNWASVILTFCDCGCDGVVRDDAPGDTSDALAIQIHKSQPLAAV